MTRTARRRWSRELQFEVDGIAVASSGPVLVHVYEPPAGERWIDSAIPGKLGALDRSSGEVLWVSPCEVGYGRGFGAGFGPQEDVLVAGPASNGHRIARMTLGSGELLDARTIPAFDEAIVFEDVVLIASKRKVIAIDPRSLQERWTYSREGERYHNIARQGSRVFVVASTEAKKKQGLIALDVKSGHFEAALIPPEQSVIHDLAADSGSLTVLLDNLTAALPREALIEYLRRSDDQALGPGLALIAIKPTAKPSDAPLWYEAIEGEEDGEFPEVAVHADAGRLYVVKGALLEARDALSGRRLDEWAVPGLDERVAWSVAQGACLVAEETRVSIFELPA
ncbi:MAG TPA: PQQ-binding-like beta-propeller repeat protein [Planctomycetota bacterium]|nr:PQQ-binding-like beta-propeller repeat protein [Planctomycetota bacterium]